MKLKTFFLAATVALFVIAPVLDRAYSFEIQNENGIKTGVPAAVPVLTKNYTNGHFKFFYTDNDPVPDNNVTLEEIQATANAMNAFWNKYADNFTEPKHYISDGKKMINVRVYYLGDGLYGQTSSDRSIIYLNSKLTVKDACKRKTISARELFRRVQYSYGYTDADGTAGNMRWIVDGTAVWSQKYTNPGIRDYMPDMNSGLEAPDRDLITERDYDAAHFWVYLQKRAGWDAVRDVWAEYATNGHDAWAAVDTVVTRQLGLLFDEYAGEWAAANYLKDKADSGNFDYSDNEISETSCGVVYGPLSHVPKVANIPVTNDTIWGRNESVKPYGADYFIFKLDPALTRIQIKLEGDDAGKLRYYILGIKNNALVSSTLVTTADHTADLPLTAGEWDTIALIVAGGSTGGAYTVTINNPCIAGKWLYKTFDNEFYLNQAASSDPAVSRVTGWVSSPECGTWNVAGTFEGSRISWTMKDSPNETCCNWMITGKVNDACDFISGTWDNLNCKGRGDISLSKTANISGAPSDMSGTPSAGPLPGLPQ